MGTSKSRESRHFGDENKVASWPSALGLIVVDGSLRPLFSNHEAITILTYSAQLAQNSLNVLRRKVRGFLLRAEISLAKSSLLYPFIQFKSGRRTYFCRAFALEKDRKSTNGTGAAFLIVLEREMPRSLALSHISQQFRLTHREQETVALLLQGLGNKEMAAHMGISENTVKAFLRTITTKMDVSGRSAIVNKVLNMVLSVASEPTEKPVRD
jgi:DNA-binding CsgD family transcriptional regulator